MSKIVFESPADEAGFVMFPNVVLMDESLSVPARLAYGLFVHFARGKGAAFPGQKRLGALLNVTERQARDYIRELERSWLIDTQRRGGRTNLYVLLALGQREQRRLDAEAEFRGRERDRNSASSVDRNSGSDEVDVEKEMQRLCESAGVRADVKFDGKPVNSASFVLAAEALAEFNQQAGTKLRVFTSAGWLSEAMKRVYGRVRAYPDLTLPEHSEIIRRTLASRWWGKGDPTIGVVYGPKVFEDNIARRPSEQTKSDALNEDLRQAMMRRRGL